MQVANRFMDSVSFLNVTSGVVITIMIVLANVYQLRIKRRFSGAIGKIMFWYSLGLAAMLALTIFNVVANILNWGLLTQVVGSRVIFLIAVAFFLRGSLVIR
jgi:hypothetical protein